MATKTISITEDAYERLKSKKSENESFSDVINKITKKISLMELAGLLTKKEAKELEENIKRSRRSSALRLENIRKELKRI